MVSVPGGTGGACFCHHCDHLTMVRRLAKTAGSQTYLDLRNENNMGIPPLPNGTWWEQVRLGHTGQGTYCVISGKLHKPFGASMALSIKWALSSHRPHPTSRFKGD